MSWDLNTWTGADRVNAAYNFLQTGANQNLLPPTSGFGTKCSTSSQCASGYKCAGGICVQIGQAGGSGGSGGTTGGGGGFGGSGNCDGGGDGGGGVPGSGPGEGPGGAGGGTGGCAGPTGISTSVTAYGDGAFGYGGGLGAGGGGGGGGGGGRGCQTATCGDGGGPGAGGGGPVSPGYGPEGDCCGLRCCRFYATGIPGDPVNVNCYCGDCPPNYGREGSPCGGPGDAPCGYGYACIDGFCREVKVCNKVCAEYYEANGEELAGCGGDDRCDECTACNGEGEGFNYCKEKEGAPCWCPGASFGRCDICNVDGSVTPGACMECAEIRNFKCLCGVISIQVCQQLDENGFSPSGPSIVNIAQEEALKECLKLCEDSLGGADDCMCNADCAPGNRCSAENLRCIPDTTP